MVTDSITNASIPMTTSNNAKDLAKKKRANRTAKLKQCKLDARREQWLSQVKNKESKEELKGHGGCGVGLMHAQNDRDQSIEKLEMKPRGEENDESVHHFSDLESPSNSPTSHSSSILGGTESGTNFTGSSRSSSSGSSGGCCSGCITEEDDEGGEEDCLDDWEAFADALAATDDKQEQREHGPDLSEQHESIVKLDVGIAAGTEISKPEPETGGMAQQKVPLSGRAWRSDDAFRPQSLPNLSKQRSLPMNSDRQCGRGGVAWGCKSVISAPSSCPICYEDLDLTDTSFLPCPCGFRLCLFCHKRILEEDGRCPGCRKHYDHDHSEEKASLDGGSPRFILARSYSMITRF